MMKNCNIFLFIVLTISCDQNIRPNLQLLGTWRWLVSSGGIDGRIETPANTGNDISIEISEKKFRRSVNGTFEDEWLYEIKKGPSIRTVDDTDLIVFESGWSQSFAIIGDTLRLYDECYDCFQSEYVKK